MKTQLLAFVASICLLVSCQGQVPSGVASVSPKEFAEKIDATPDAQIVDVRTAEEFSGGHLQNAINVDWYEKQDFDAKIATLDKSKPVFVYCAAGARSIKAANRLYALGFAHVYDMKGGYVKWNAESATSANPAKTEGMGVQEYRDLVKSGKVLVDFYAPWCEPCKKMAPYLKRMQTETKGLTVVTLNADEHKTLARHMKVDALPRLILYVDGSETWRHDGYISEEELKKQL